MNAQLEKLLNDPSRFLDAIDEWFSEYQRDVVQPYKKNLSNLAEHQKSLSGFFVRVGYECHGGEFSCEPLCDGMNQHASHLDGKARDSYIDANAAFVYRKCVEYFSPMLAEADDQQLLGLVALISQFEPLVDGRMGGLSGEDYNLKLSFYMSLFNNLTNESLLLGFANTPSDEQKHCMRAKLDRLSAQAKHIQDRVMPIWNPPVIATEDEDYDALVITELNGFCISLCESAAAMRASNHWFEAGRISQTIDGLRNGIDEFSNDDKSTAYTRAKSYQRLAEAFNLALKPCVNMEHDFLSKNKVVNPVLRYGEKKLQLKIIAAKILQTIIFPIGVYRLYRVLRYKEQYVSKKIVEDERTSTQRLFDNAQLKFLEKSQQQLNPYRQLSRQMAASMRGVQRMYNDYCRDGFPLIDREKERQPVYNPDPVESFYKVVKAKQLQPPNWSKPSAFRPGLSCAGVVSGPGCWSRALRQPGLSYAEYVRLGAPSREQKDARKQSVTVNPRI